MEVETQVTFVIVTYGLRTLGWAPLNSIDAVLIGIAQAPPIPYASVVSGISSTASR
jgi:hypothetical protein